MDKLFLDFETYCDLDIKEVGLYKYLAHPSFHPWCCGYALNDESPYMWTTESLEGVFGEFLQDPSIKLVAYNAEFELGVINTVWPEFNVTSERMIDVMALACSYGYSLGLDKFCGAMGLPVGKDKKGTALIRKLCMPQKKTAFNTEGRWYPDTAPKDFEGLYDYCKTDVEIMRDAYNRLPSDDLTALEQLIWRHTVLQNQRGLPIDVDTARAVRHMLRVYNIEMQKELSTLTDGAVRTGKQVKKIREYLEDREDVVLPNLKAETVAEVLRDGGLPPVATRVLEIRQLLAHSSTAKFDSMVNREHEGRVHGNLAYHWAHTGRFAGRGLQIHNLPVATLDDPEDAIDKFQTYKLDTIQESYPNVNHTASALIRPSIKASEGKKLLVVDYTSIENVFLHWVAGDMKTLKDFSNGIDQYKRYASRRFDVDYDDVTKEQRTYAKPCVLGLGYGGAEGALIHVAKGYGIELDRAKAKVDVKFYRKKLYPMIPTLWYEVFNLAKETIASREPNVLITKTTRIEFRYAGGYLFILLPSGRRLAYPSVETNSTWVVNVKGKPVQFEAGISYVGLKNGIWGRHGIHPGLMTENIIQGLARDCLCYGTLCAEQGGYPVLATVHDEAICEVPDNSSYTVEELSELLCTLQAWSADVPVSAEGYEAYRYRKE